MLKSLIDLLCMDVDMGGQHRMGAGSSVRMWNGLFDGDHSVGGQTKR